MKTPPMGNDRQETPMGPWTENEMTVHRRVVARYPVDEMQQPLPGDHIRRWLATVDASNEQLRRMREVLLYLQGGPSHHLSAEARRRIAAVLST